jgi:hypothetical protein
MASQSISYSSIAESSRILDLLFEVFQNDASLPAEVKQKRADVKFTGKRDLPYFPIPFKETETAAALKAVEGALAALLADVREGSGKSRQITVNQEKTTAFLFQAYLARVGGLGKLDKNVRQLLKGEWQDDSGWQNRRFNPSSGVDTDLLQAQSNPYRRMSANLYETAKPGEYFHIHGSLEASTTLKMIGLEPFRPDLETHADIVNTIEPAVKKLTVTELEELNARHRQAGVKAFKHEDFLQTPHVCLIPPFHDHDPRQRTKD